MVKRCSRGSRRNKKTKQCVRKSAMPTPRKKCPKGSRKDKKTGKCRRKLSKSQNDFLAGIQSVPTKTVSGVVTGIKGMESMTEKAISSLPKMKATKSKKSATGKRRNPWMAHLSAFRKAHPGMKLSSAMKAAKKTYKKV
jgi:hypothetical protein